MPLKDYLSWNCLWILDYNLKLLIISYEEFMVRYKGVYGRKNSYSKIVYGQKIHIPKFIDIWKKKNFWVYSEI